MSEGRGHRRRRPATTGNHSDGPLQRFALRQCVLTHSPITRSIAEFMNFFSRTVAERTSAGQRQSIQENSYTAHVYSRASDSLAGVIVTDQDYPVRVAFSLLNKILDEFTTKVQKGVWEQKARESRAAGKQYLVDYPQLQEYVVKYQDPKQADTIMKVQQELDETKIILVRLQPLCDSVSSPADLAQRTAQDNRIRPGTRREARFPRRQIRRPFCFVSTALFSAHADADTQFCCQIQIVL